MSINNLVADAINDKLVGGSIGCPVAHLQYIDNAPLPYAVYSLHAGGPMNTNPSDLRDEIYFVRAYAATAAAAGTIDTAISNLLHKQTLAVTGYTNIRTIRETDLELVENPPSGSRVFMCGGLYRVTLDS